MPRKRDATATLGRGVRCDWLQGCRSRRAESRRFAPRGRPLIPDILESSRVSEGSVDMGQRTFVSATPPSLATNVHPRVPSSHTPAAKATPTPTSTGPPRLTRGLNKKGGDRAVAHATACNQHAASRPAFFDA